MLALSKRLEKLEAQAESLIEARSLYDYFHPTVDPDLAAWLDSLTDESLVNIMFRLLDALPERPPTPAGHYSECWCRCCQAARDWDGVHRLTEAEKAAWLADPWNLDDIWTNKLPLGVGNRGMAGDYVETQIARLMIYADRIGVDI